MDLDIDVGRLKLLKANHLSQKYSLEDQILKSFPKSIASLEQQIAGYKKDMAYLAEETKPIESGATYTGTTEAGGSFTFTQLKPGAYEIVELSAPEGWQKDPQTYTTTVVSGDTVSYILKNQANPGLKILKYDRKTYEVLSGVTFEIFRDGVSLGKFQTEAESENFRRCPQRSRINYQEKISRAAGMQRTGPERPGALCY